MWGILVGASVRCADERTGCFLILELTKTDQFMGIYRMGADIGISGLHSRMAVYRTGQDNRFGES